MQSVVADPTRFEAFDAPNEDNPSRIEAFAGGCERLEGRLEVIAVFCRFVANRGCGHEVIVVIACRLPSTSCVQWHLLRAAIGPVGAFQLMEQSQSVARHCSELLEPRAAVGAAWWSGSTAPAGGVICSVTILGPQALLASAAMVLSQSVPSHLWYVVEHMYICLVAVVQQPRIRTKAALFRLQFGRFYYGYQQQP